MKKLRVQNFKCFEDKTMNFKKLTVLAGGNGAGKSTIIQILLVLLQTYNANSKEFGISSKKIYLNDYFCELGNSKRLLNYDAKKDTIRFEIYDKNEFYTEIECSINDNDLSIFDIKNFNQYPKIKPESASSSNLNPLKYIFPINFLRDLYNVSFTNHNFKNNSLSFLKYFDFIGADRFGPKTFHYTDSNFSVINVGKFGEYTALVLNNYKFEPILNSDGDLLSNVNFWLTEIFKYTKIDTTYIDEANIALLKIKNHKNGEYESPVNMPYGISYLLPIIVSCLVRQIPKNRLFENYIYEDEENELIVIENPEAHLHPFAQSKLGYFLAKMSKHIQIIVETHSEHIINGIRLATLEDDVDKNEIIINFLESNEKSIQPEIKEIMIDEFSDLSDWPLGFFDQQAIDVSKIFQERAKIYAKN